jgi:hypothetical protein
MSGLVQVSSTVNWGGNTSVNVSVPSAAAGNSILLLTAGVDFGGSVFPTFTANDGVAYSLGKRQQHGTYKLEIAILYLHAISAGTKTIAVGSSSSAGNLYGYSKAYEVSGLANAAPIAVGNQGTGTTPVETGTTGTLAAATNFALGGIATNGDAAGFNTPAGFTNSFRDNTNASQVPVSIEYLITAVNTALNPSWATLGTSQNWVNALAVFADAAATRARLINGTRLRSLVN